MRLCLGGPDRIVTNMSTRRQCCDRRFVAFVEYCTALSLCCE